MLTPLSKIVALAIVWHLGTASLLAEDAKPAAQYVYKTIGDRKLTLDLDYPADWKPTDKRPAMVFFFGGGWTTGTPGQFKPQAEYFAKRGLVCIRADYRLRIKDNVHPDKCVEDARSAMRWVRSHAAQLGIDTSRIVAAGGSAGGHLAACTFFADGINATNDDLSISPKPDAMVLYNPVVDMTALHSGKGARLIAGMSDDLLKQISPSSHATKDMPPTLIIDGTKDMLYQQISDFVQKSKALGAPIEIKYTEGQPHGFFNRPQFVGPTTQQVDEFLTRIGYLSKDPVVPLPTTVGTPETMQ